MHHQDIVRPLGLHHDPDPVAASVAADRCRLLSGLLGSRRRTREPSTQAGNITAADGRGVLAATARVRVIAGTTAIGATGKRAAPRAARRPKGGDTDQIKAVAAGEGDIAVSNTYYFGRIAGSKKPEDQAVTAKVGVFFPNQNDRGTHVNISGAGVLKNAPNKESAVKFLE